MTTYKVENTILDAQTSRPEPDILAFRAIAHRLMEEALAILDRTEDRLASVHVDHAISILGLRTTAKLEELLRAGEERP